MVFISQVFRARTPPEAIDLVSRLLEYTPSSRISPLQACAHTFFEELREANTRLPNGRELPPLFNFTEQGKLHIFRGDRSDNYCCDMEFLSFWRLFMSCFYNIASFRPSFSIWFLLVFPILLFLFQDKTLLTRFLHSASQKPVHCVTCLLCEYGDYSVCCRTQHSALPELSATAGSLCTT